MLSGKRIGFSDRPQLLRQQKVHVFLTIAEQLDISHQHADNGFTL
jgi:hypothetical protein